MTYPNVPDFRSGTQGAAWWRYTSGTGTTQVCEATGSAVIKGAQRWLRDHAPATRQVFGSHTADRSVLTADGIVGPATLKVLYSYFDSVGTDRSLLSDLEADFNANNAVNAEGRDVSRPGRPLRPGTVRALIWAANENTGDLRRVDLPGGAILPTWGVAPASARDEVILCWQPGIDAEPSRSGARAIDRSPAGPPAVEPAMTRAEKIGLGVGITSLALGVAAIAVAASKKKKRRRR